MVMTKAEKSARLSRLWLYRVFPLLRCIHSAVEQRAPLRRRVSHWTALGLTLSFALPEPGRVDGDAPSLSQPTVSRIVGGNCVRAELDVGSCVGEGEHRAAE